MQLCCFSTQVLSEPLLLYRPIALAQLLVRRKAITGNIRLAARSTPNVVQGSKRHLGSDHSLVPSNQNNMYC